MIKYVKKDMFESKASVFLTTADENCKMNGNLAKSVKANFPEVETYLSELKETADPKLGEMLVSFVSEGNVVITLLTQRAERSKRTTSYSALKRALKKLRFVFEDLGVSEVALPKGMCCGKAGGKWEVVEKLIKDEFEDYPNLTCYICER